MPPRRLRLLARCFFFNDTATTEIYTLSLHDALPICRLARRDELGFSALPIADVTDRRGDQDLVAVLDRAQADLDREFPPVRAPSQQVETRPHGSDAYAARVVLPVPHVPLSEPFGHQVLDAFPDNVIVRIPEQRRDLAVGEAHD